MGEVQSLIPASVNMMALTATATKTGCLSVSCVLGLKSPFVLTNCPAKTNLMYSVSTFKSVEMTFGKFANKLQRDRTDFPQRLSSTVDHLMCVVTYAGFYNTILAQYLPILKMH